MRPLRNHIVVRPVYAPSIIFVRDQNTQCGDVVFVGPDARVVAGKRVMYGYHAPVAFEHEGEKLLRMTDRDILFVMED